MNATLRVLAGGLLSCGLSLSAWADFDADWYTIDSGGAIFSTGGSYALGGTIGQHDAGVMSGGSFEIVGGFWAISLSQACPGDVNGDGAVQQLDLNLLLSAWGTCPGDAGYIPGAGTLSPDTDCVTQLDLNVLLSLWGATCP